MNPYDVIGVSPSATDNEISQSYKRLAKKYHPDLNPGNEAAAKKMGEINRAYDDIKTMRQNGTSAEEYERQQSAYGYQSYYQNCYQNVYDNPFDPFFTAGQATNTYTRQTRHSPVGVLLAVMVMFFFVRLLLSMIFGGFGGSYYVNGQNGVSTGYAPGYGYYQTTP